MRFSSPRRHHSAGVEGGIPRSLWAVIVVIWRRQNSGGGERKPRGKHWTTGQAATHYILDRRVLEQGDDVSRPMAVLRQLCKGCIGKGYEYGTSRRVELLCSLGVGAYGLLLLIIVFLQPGGDSVESDQWVTLHPGIPGTSLPHIIVIGLPVLGIVVGGVVSDTRLLVCPHHTLALDRDCRHRGCAGVSQYCHFTYGRSRARARIMRLRICH